MSRKYPIFKLEVKKWLTSNKISNPMPYMIMEAFLTPDASGKTETSKSIHVRCRGNIFEKESVFCCKCGKPLDHNVSRYFGIGPVCGNHNYTNPFETKEELAAAVKEMTIKLNNTVWEGWVPKSQITKITPLEDYPIEIKLS